MLGLSFDNPWDNDKRSNLRNKSLGSFARMLGFTETNEQNPKGLSGLKLVKIFSVLLFFGWLSTGFYTIEQDQLGIVMRFGSYHRTSQPGLNWKLPDPIEKTEKVSVTRLNKEFIGVRMGSNSAHRSKFSTTQTSDKSTSIPSESQMLTGDENIIDMHFFVQWRVKNAYNYLFNIKDKRGENTVRSAAESAMREVVGVTKLYDALSEQRNKVETNAQMILQDILDSYNSGIEVLKLGILYSYVAPEVRDAYRDIQSAKADKEKFINQAYTYRNEVLPNARADARTILEGAKAYKETRIAAAIGESSRFLSVRQQYLKSKNIVGHKIYMETMAKVLQNTNKIIVDSGSASPMSLLSLNDLINKKKMDSELLANKVKDNT